MSAGKESVLLDEAKCNLANRGKSYCGSFHFTTFSLFVVFFYLDSHVFNMLGFNMFKRPRTLRTELF